MGEAREPIVFNDLVARDPRRFLDVIDHVLAMHYLEPALRSRVVRLQRRLIEMELNAHHQAEGGGR